MTQEIPSDDTITLAALNEDPFPIYRRLRAQTPIVRAPKLGRILLTKAVDTKYVKDNPELFSSDDPLTPMTRAFQAHTLMRKDGQAHLRERMAMAPAFSPKVILSDWVPAYAKAAEAYVARLPKGEVVDLFSALAGPYAARGLASVLGMEEASDDQMQRWSQSLIDGSGNFGEIPELFEASDVANAEINALLDAAQQRHREAPNSSAFSVMLNADDPIEMSQIYANIKIAIGGGINEPRDALLTTLCGLLGNPEQLETVRKKSDWDAALEEGIRWVAPISVSARKVTQDTEIRGYFVPEGETVMTIQASANRDEDIHEDGESFNVYRKPQSHQSFGNGPHFCQGTHIARRAIAQIMLPILFDRFPEMQVPDWDDVLWRGFGFRGPVQMPVLLQ